MLFGGCLYVDPDGCLFLYLVILEFSWGLSLLLFTFGFIVTLINNNLNIRFHWLIFDHPHRLARRVCSNMLSYLLYNAILLSVSATLA